MFGTAYLGETIYATFQTTRASTGEAYDAATTPAMRYRVYEEGNEVPLREGIPEKLDDNDTTGLYVVSVPATLVNGFEADKYYSVHVTATVDNVAGAQVVSRFVVRAGPPALEAYIMNKKEKRGNVFTIYAADGVTPLYVSTVTDTDTSTIFGPLTAVPG